MPKKVLQYMYVYQALKNLYALISTKRAPIDFNLPK